MSDLALDGHGGLNAISLRFRSRRRIFFASLLLVTAIPVLGLGVGLGLSSPGGHRPAVLLASLVPIIALTGNGHVAATVYIYLDKGFRPLLRGNWRRFFLSPALAVTGTMALYAAGPIGRSATNLIFFVWLLFHYSRQNLGVVAFAAQERKVGPLPSSIKRIVDLSAAGGICAILARPDMIGARALWWVGLALLAASAAVMVRALVCRRMLQDPILAAFVFLSWAFFLPSLLGDDLLVTFTSYAIAHGAQYLIFLTVTAGNSSSRLLGVAVMVGAGGALWLGLQKLGAFPVGLALYQGVTIGHFMVDAKVWRMRESLQRSILRERFGFLFTA